MAEKLTESTWTAFAKKRDLDDSALVKALKAFDKTEETKPEPRLDALGDVVVQLDVDGRRVTGRGVATDVVEASARAYLAAINRALQVAAKDAGQSNEVTP